MAKAEIAVTNTSSIIEEIMRRQDMVARRAFELFQSHMDSFNAELDDWLMAERELAMPPEIQLRRQNGQFEIDAAMPDVDPKKLDVKVTPEDVLISAEREIMKPEGKTTAEAEGWRLKEMVPGFHAMSCHTRETEAVQSPGSAPMQWVFSDGLASVSLFVEAFDSRRHKVEGVMAMGATHALTRRMHDKSGEWWLTVIGEVPRNTLAVFAQGLERVR